MNKDGAIAVETPRRWSNAQQSRRREGIGSNCIPGFIILFMVSIVAGNFDGTHTRSPGPHEIDEGVESSVSDNGCTQHASHCTHRGNARGFEASSTFSSRWTAIKAFMSKCFSWSSVYVYASNYEPQWIKVRLNLPRRVSKISFAGDERWPGNTPTAYELRGFKPETEEWETIQEWETAQRDHAKRSHHISSPRRRRMGSYRDYRIVVNKTVWMENNVGSGYVQLSNVELCWDPTPAPTAAPAGSPPIPT